MDHVLPLFEAREPARLFVSTDGRTPADPDPTGERQCEVARQGTAHTFQVQS